MRTKKLLFLTNDINLQLGGQGLSNIIILDYLSRDFKINIVNQQFFKGTSNYREMFVDYNADFRKFFIKGLVSLQKILWRLENKQVDLIIISASPFSTLIYLFLINSLGIFNNIQQIHFCRIDPLSSIFSASRIPFVLYPLGLLYYRKLDKIVVQNPDMGKTFKKSYRVSDKKITLIPNPVRPDYKKLLSEKGKLKIDATKPWITTISRLETKQKDPETLIKAFALVKDRVDSASLIICGTGNKKDKLKDLGNALGLSKDIYFLGFVKNPFIVLKESDVFVLSSRAEGFGKVIVEAQLAKVPVVATDCPVGPRWALDNGEAGELVPVGDEKKMELAILRALKDKEKRKKYIKKSLELTKRHYPERFYELLDELVSSV